MATKVYKLVNQSNGNVYVGLTSLSLETRLKCHLSALKTGKAYSSYMLADFKAGHKFTIELLNDCEHVFSASNLERYYIRLLKSTDPKFGYNIHPGGLDAQAFINGVAVKNLTTGQVFPSVNAAAKSINASVTTIKKYAASGLKYADCLWAFYGQQPANLDALVQL